MKPLILGDDMKYDKYENYLAKLSSQTLKHTVCLTLFTLEREKRSKQLDVFQVKAENWTFTSVGGVFLSPRSVIAAWIGASSLSVSGLLFHAWHDQGMPKLSQVDLEVSPVSF